MQSPYSPGVEAKILLYKHRPCDAFCNSARHVFAEPAKDEEKRRKRKKVTLCLYGPMYITKAVLQMSHVQT